MKFFFVLMVLVALFVVSYYPDKVKEWFAYLIKRVHFPVGHLRHDLKLKAVSPAQKLWYIRTMMDALQSALAQMGGNLGVNIAAMIAQGALESCWGTSGLFKTANNIFGVKWNGIGPYISMLTWEQRIDGTWYQTMAPWQKYNTLALAMIGYSKTIHNGYYNAALPYANGPADLYVDGLSAWATDQGYKAKVKVIGREIASLGGPAWV